MPPRTPRTPAGAGGWRLVFYFPFPPWIGMPVNGRVPMGGTIGGGPRGRDPFARKFAISTTGTTLTSATGSRTMAKAKPAASININARRKGKTGELEFAAEINHRLGGKFLERNLEQVRYGGHDLILNVGEMNSDVGKKLNQLAFEIKRRKKINRADIRQWWDQTVKQSQRINKVPVLAFRQDRDNWNCLFPLSKTLNIKNPDNCVQMGIDLFVTLVKNPELKNDGCF